MSRDAHIAAWRYELRRRWAIFAGRVAEKWLRLLPLDTYVHDALIGEAFSARMFGDNPELPPEAVKAYRWAEQQFLRIAKKEVGERDLIG